MAFPPHVARLSPPFLVFRSDGGSDMRKVSPSKEFLTRLLHYDPETGLLYHRKKFELGRAKPIGSRRSKNKRSLSVGVQIDKKRVVFFAHRIAWIMVNGPIPEGLQIDHINGISCDNRIENLRCVTGSVNMQNMRKSRKSSTSGVLGVFHRPSGRWGAKIQLYGKPIAIGTFDTKEEAYQAYVAKKREIHEGCTI